MRSLGASHLLMLLAFVVLVLDSRRFRTLARLTGRGRRPSAARAIPPGENPDQVGLPLRQIQMRSNVDWEDGGAGWEGPEILPDVEDDPDEAEEEPPSFLPVLWKPVPELLVAGSA
jgi:hypothetical protein